MSLDILVLRALLRLARRRTAATPEELLVRIDAEPEELARVLDRLVRAELVHRTPQGARLSLGGLAVAAATCAPVEKPRRGGLPTKEAAAPARARVLPLSRRRRAA